ncbi:MAG TPA: type II toxin-antitoxin system RelE/ParE family toxin [Cytophagaceae bacterium]|jgi:plasmid stabilization system protein ParE|nr:type II toxin-antitoxin system RelE/ParE family toxin [Cytophagaceae bacterium]
MDSKTQKTPATYKVKITKQALLNIDEITGYIAFINHQPLNAIKVGDAIFSKINRIGKRPFAFKECEELPTKSKMYRKAVCYSWHIVYRVSNIDVVILGLLHTSRKPSRIKALRKIK